MRNLVISILVSAATLVGIETSHAYPVKDTDTTRIASLPPIEALTSRSDYTMFLRPNVPVELQRQALRKLWLSDPIFAYRDGLDNYDYDYKGYPDEQRPLNNFARVLDQ